MKIIAGLLLAYYLYQLAALFSWPRFRLLTSAGEETRDTSADTSAPCLSVVIAARNEAAAITATLDSLLRQRYEPLEILVVDDRSEDGTGSILDDYLQKHEASRRVPKLKVLHVDKLPEGWLGKNHALYEGYLHARGELLLFTDADVRFHRDTLRDAVAAMQAERADHLALTPYMRPTTLLLRLFVHYFMFSAFLWGHPWECDTANPAKFVGIGAFNLIRRSCYERIGTHRAFPYHPVDDLHLGERVKRHGFRQRLLSGIHYLTVEWYPDFGAALQGLEKNVLPVFRYRLTLVGAAIAMQLAGLTAPYLLVWLTHGAAQAMFALEILLLSFVYVLLLGKLTPLKAGLELPLLPLAILLQIYAMARSAALFFRRGGMSWRGTFYTRRELMARNSEAYAELDWIRSSGSKRSD